MEGHHLIFRVIMLLGAIAVVDILTWLYLRRFSPHLSPANILRRIHFPLSITFGLAFFAFGWLKGLPGLDPQDYRDWFVFTGIMVVIWLPRAVFLFSSLLTHLFFLFLRKWKNRVRRSGQLSLMLAGLILAISLWGIFIGKSHFIARDTVVKHTVLPMGFNGFRIAQFSDAHLGSFGKQENVRKGLRLLQAQNADVIVFTGDLVNVVAEEAYPYTEDLRQLKAPYGKFAILGNHDQGDYLKGDTIRPPEENRQLLREFFRKTGFVLMEDTAVMLLRGGDTLILAGVDNWGLPPFKQKGDLGKALGYYPGRPTVLFSHDPSHWDAEILGHPEVMLTLSGHTHGMQMGIFTSNFRWSPAVIKYPRWGGLYEENGQYLYVSVGFGFLGFPGRMGIRPEISVLQLETEGNLP